MYTYIFLNYHRIIFSVERHRYGLVAIEKVIIFRKRKELLEAVHVHSAGHGSTMVSRAPASQSVMEPSAFHPKAVKPSSSSGRFSVIGGTHTDGGLGGAFLRGWLSCHLRGALSLLKTGHPGGKALNRDGCWQGRKLPLIRPTVLWNFPHTYPDMA